MGSDGNGDDDDDESHDCRTIDNRRETAEEIPVNTIYWPMWTDEVTERCVRMSASRCRSRRI